MNQNRIDEVAQAMADHADDMPLSTCIQMLKDEGYTQADIRSGWVLYLEGLARQEGRITRINALKGDK